jgi:hypothetical protein
LGSGKIAGSVRENVKEHARFHASGGINLAVREKFSPNMSCLQTAVRRRVQKENAAQLRRPPKC